MYAKVIAVTPIAVAILLGCSSNSTSSSSTSSQSESENSIDSNSSTEFTDTAFFANLTCATSISSTSSAEPGTDFSIADAQNLIESNTGLSVNCSDDANANLPGPGVGNTGTGSLTHVGVETALSAATISSNDNEDNQTEIDFIVHNGNARSLLQSDNQSTNDGSQSVSRRDWGIYNANIAFLGSLTQINTPEFTGGSFEVIDVLNTLGAVDIPSDRNTATFVGLVLDGNNNGMAEVEDEAILAVSGNINVTGESPNWSITLDVTLADGTTVTGGYDGDFHFLPELE